MDFSFILTSLNKISLFAFIITFCVLAYEIYLLVNERNKKTVPSVPEFNENKTVNMPHFTVLNLDNKQSAIKKSNNLLIIVLIIFLIVFGLTSAIGFKSLSGDNQPKPTPITEIISSKGIILYDTNWRELNEAVFKKLKEGDRVIIGIDKTKDPDVNMARIKINQLNWLPEDATLNYNENNNVFYRTYQIATNESSLKIEAQLHSQAKGWLGN